MRRHDLPALLLNRTGHGGQGLSGPGCGVGEGVWEERIGAEETDGLAEADLDRATEIALKNPYWNPRPVTAGGLRALLQNAWAGNAPSD